MVKELTPLHDHHGELLGVMLFIPMDHLHKSAVSCFSIQKCQEFLWKLGHLSAVQKVII
jgi:hypothetical protein